MKRLFTTAIALLLILALAGGCVTDVPDPAPDQYEPEPTDTYEPDGISRQSGDTPLLWRATAPNGQIMYLFGSIHAGSEDLYPLPGYVTDAFERSDYLAVEADIVAFENDFAALMEMMALLSYPEGYTVVDDIGEELYEEALALITDLEEFSELGIPAEMLSGFRPYFWTNLLTSVIVERAGMDLELGVDKFFLTAAMERGMEILEIESATFQLELLVGFSPALQSLLLRDALNLDKETEGMAELYRLWRQGDEAGLIALINEESDEHSEEDLELMEEFLDALFTQRDLNMADVAEFYMSEGKAVFFVVGAAHLVGEDSVTDLLSQRGYIIERVQ